jgi:predicted lipoprotein with Yx(FWY)xxD motif
MKRIYIVGGVLAAAILAGGGVALDVALAGAATPAGVVPTPSAVAAPPSGAPAPAGIAVATLAPGTALVDTAGRALYLFEADTGTTSTCTGDCAQVWPPLISPSMVPGTTGAAQPSLVNTTTRPDGTRQVTYNGHPLYYFAGDTAPGDVKGQDIHNFGGGWYVVTPGGNKIDPDDGPAPSRAAAPAPSGNGY